MNSSKPDIHMKTKLTQEQGFTLVELMITLVMSVIIIAALYSAYIVQQRSYYTQGQVVEMQQNIRSALEVMSSDMRMAGFDPTGRAGAEVITATSNEFSFTLDEDENGELGDPGEAITFAFGDTNSDGTNDDSDDDGLVDADDDGDGVTDHVPFRRESNGGGLQPIAENIQAIEFEYIISKGDGTFDLTIAPSNAQIRQMVGVQISILAVASQRDAKYLHSSDFPTGYTTGSGATWGPFGDNFRRRMLVTTVNCRNLGL